MSIQDPLNNIHTFADLAIAVQKAEVKLSYFGRCYVCINKGEDTIDLSSLVGHMVYLLIKNRNFSEIERSDVKKISKKINQFYLISDDLARNSSVITRLALIIRKVCRTIFYLSRSTYNLREYWSSGSEECCLPQRKIYKFYTEEQSKEKFGFVPDKLDDNFDYSVCYPDDEVVWFRQRTDLSKPRNCRLSVSNYWDG